MKELSDKVILLTKLASSIASDDLSKVDTTTALLKKNAAYPETIYETILQCYLFCGFPAVIESLIIFKKHFPGYRKRKSAFNIEKFRKSGLSNCKLVYKNNFKKLLENMNYYSPDLKEWMIIEGYGKVLGRKGLTLLQREFINVSILITRLYKNQLHSHLRGCIYLGATKAELTVLLERLKSTAGINNVQLGKSILKSIKILD